MLKFTKQHSELAKGLAIIVMIIHHVWGFPDRFNYELSNPLLHRIGMEMGIVVGLFVFLNGIGLYSNRTSLIMGEHFWNKIKRTYISFWRIAILFLFIGFISNHFQFDIVRV